MDETDYLTLFLKIGSKFDDSNRRVQRFLGEDFERYLKSNPRDVLLRLLEQISFDYVRPLEMMLATGAYLSQVFDVPNFVMSFSGNDELDLKSNRQTITQFVDSFYEMTTQVGFQGEFKKAPEVWWKQ